MALPDAAVREAVSTQLGDTMFVEAGAGSGKTTCLAARFVGLVEAGVEADRIAAITFTEKRRANWRTGSATSCRRRSATSDRCRAALPALDRAAICTLHAFAQRLLSEHPIEAGLPPRVTVLDEIASQLAFELRWEAFEDRIIEDPELERPLRLLLARGSPRRPPAPGGGAVRRQLGPGRGADRRAGPGRAAPRARSSARRGRRRCGHGRPVPRQRGRAARPARRVRRLGVGPAGSRGRRQPAGTAGPGAELRRVRTGRAGNWPDVNRVRDRVQALEPVRDDIRDRVQQAALERLAAELARFTVDAAEERRRAGELEFHDLLVLARAVLRDPVHGVEVRAAAAERYQRLLLDEFQDTDPIQVELAVLLASRDPDAGAKPWWEVEVEPGRLFFVGDPKQSIYRFRRADIAVFLRARNSVGGGVEQLTANFRTTAPILEWVNRTFGRVICEDGESQPAYVPLDPVRGAAPSGPAVSFIGCPPHPKAWRADDLREAEADDVAAAIREVVDDGWAVRDNKTGDWRPGPME